MRDSILDAADGTGLRGATKHVIRFVANPTQNAFIRSKAEADLFSCRMGEGKSAGLVWSCFHHTKHNPGAVWVFIRDTWENMRDTTQKEFFHWFPPGVMGTYKASTKTFKWAVGELRGEVMFLGIQDPVDASKLQSRMIAGFAIDEPAPASHSGGIDELIFDVALSRRRQSGIKWYAGKLAENNPDESHWTYRRFVEPGNPDFKCWQTTEPENLKNLPADYYRKLRQQWQHRPDLIRRFIDGHFGFQQLGFQVTPEWSDAVHLARGLLPVRGAPLHLLWDFGLNPTCLITQVTPLGHWLFLEGVVGEGIGVYELIGDSVKPIIADRYRSYDYDHIGDPAGMSREQSSAEQTAVRVIRRELGGRWRAGPSALESRIDPLRAVLRKQHGGRGIIQVDRDYAKVVWHALRGGWHRPVNRQGVVGREPVKNNHSHPGDAAGYGAAVLFPLGRMQQARHVRDIQKPTYFRSSGLGFERPGARIPKEARTIPMRGSSR